MSDLQISTRRLRADFIRQDDRFGHTISRWDGATWQPLLASVEGPADDAWPASGPFQQATSETGDDGVPRIFLLGMAGTSHWSASVEATDQSGLLFDVACRLKTQPQRLGSRYRLLPGSQDFAGPAAAIVVSNSGATATLSLPSGQVSCYLLPLEGQPTWQLHPEGEELRIAGDMTTGIAVPTTIRWRYELVVDG